ncbi:MAG: ComEC/Rec2 family competence protein [Candidatus Paceibacterota bacterium]|jgi:competence protein ComEC|nr:ComEC family competence protein [bacterium]
MHKADIFLIFCLFYLGGIFFASFFVINYVYSAVIFLILGLSIIGLQWKKFLAIFGFSFLFFSFGIFLFGFNLSRVFNAPILDFNNSEVILIGRVVRDSDGFSKKKIIVNVLSVNGREENWGKVLISGDKYSVVEEGDSVEVFGILKKPENFSNFDYRGYLAKENISAVLNYPDIKVIKRDDLNIFLSIINGVKTKISDSITTDFMVGQAQVVQAMILGESEKMSPDFKEELSRSGISHAIAISGSHFILIASFLFTFFLFLGFWKKQSLVFVLLLIFCYMFLISFPASSVRAGIMIGFVYLARIVDRQAQSWRLLIIAAFLMCLQNPLVLKHDLGFQLSFLAVSGLIFLAPLINSFLVKIFKGKMNYLSELFAITLAAQIFVLPVLFSISQSFSFFSILANMLIIPIMPICLGLGFIYCFLFFIPFVHSFIAFLLYPFIFILIFIAKIFSAMPFMYFSFPTWLVFIFYIGIGIFIYKKRRKYSL